MELAKIKQKQDVYIVEYPEFAKLADEQIKIFWPWNEIKVEKDKQDLLVGMSEPEKHATITTLKLFTQYELFVGNEHWLGRILKTFQRPEIQRMAAAFGHVELNSHAPFYSRINEELGLATYEFYTSYVNDPILAERMAFVESLVDHEDDLISLAGFSMIEGAVLYSSFAYLKHFQAQGKNKLMNLVRGINMSARDENLHAIGGALLFRTLKNESNLTIDEEAKYAAAVLTIADTIREHEHRINEMLFEKGKIEGISLVQMNHFSDSRINLCLEHLGYHAQYKVTYNPIADWFYKGINDYQFNDFFSGIGREYQRDWDEHGFNAWDKKGK